MCRLYSPVHSNMYGLIVSGDYVYIRIYVCTRDAFMCVVVFTEVAHGLTCPSGTKPYKGTYFLVLVDGSACQWLAVGCKYVHTCIYEHKWDVRICACGL